MSRTIVSGDRKSLNLQKLLAGFKNLFSKNSLQSLIQAGYHFLCGFFPFYFPK